MRIAATLLFCFLFLIYLVGISPSVYGGDSGDIILAGYFLGIAHPPGYPINSLLGFVFTHLPIQASVAYKAGLMSAVLMSAAATILFLILRTLTKSVFVSICSVLILAFTHLFWLYAHVAEVFQLNLLLVLVSVYFLMVFGEVKKQKFLRLSLLFLGLAVFHHQTSVLLAPAFLYFIYKANKKTFSLRVENLKTALFFCLGALPYLIVPILASRQPPINWDNPVNLENLLRLIVRADYGSFAASPDLVGASFKSRALQLVSYFAFLKNDFKLIGLIFTVIGAIYVYFKHKTIFWFTFWSVFFTGPFFLFYSSFSLSSDFIFGIWERFVLLSYLFLTIYISFGIKATQLAFLEFYKKKLKRIRLGLASYLVLTSGILLLFPFYLLLSNWNKADLSQFKKGDWLGNDVLVSTEPNSILYLFDDTVAFNTQYIYYTTDEFADRKVIVGGSLRHKYYREQVARDYPDIKLPEGFLGEDTKQSGEYMADLIGANLKTYKHYTIDFSPPIDGYLWRSQGLVKELVDESGQKVDLEKNYRDLVSKYQFSLEEQAGYKNFIEQTINRFYSFSFSEMGGELLRSDSVEDSVFYFKLAIDILPSFFPAYLGLGDSYAKLGECENSKSAYLEATSQNRRSVLGLTKLGELERDCFKNETLADEWFGKADRLNKVLYETPIN